MDELHHKVAQANQTGVPDALITAPERLCLVCRKLKDRSFLLRLVTLKDSKEIVPNPDGRKSGKGLYFCRSAGCISQIEKSKKLKKQYLEKLNQHKCLDWMKLEVETSNDSGVPQVVEIAK